MIPQIQKNTAKGTRYSSGTKSGITAPAVPRAMKKAESPSRMACILFVKPIFLHLD